MSMIYSIRVKNHLENHWAHWFTQMSITNLENGLTELAGPVDDQEVLHCILEKIRDLNLVLISVEQEGDVPVRREEEYFTSKGLVYEITVKAVGEPWWAGWFEEVEILALEQGEFLLTVILKDQPALHGLLARVRAAHLTLLSVRRVPDTPTTPARGSDQGLNNEYLK
jgi:hypothetical protein